MRCREFAPHVYCKRLVQDYAPLSTYKCFELPTRGGQMQASGDAKERLADAGHRMWMETEVPRVRARAR
jgi:hypothetical protein